MFLSHSWLSICSAGRRIFKTCLEHNTDGSKAITGWSYGCGASEEEFLVSGNEFYSAPHSHQSNLSAKKKNRLATLSVPCLTNGSDRRTLGFPLGRVAART